ncbi:MAG: FG-GAP-like repeat-containing protein, partial [Syntrophorhabdus sp.]
MGQTKGLHLLIACFSFLLLCGQVLAGTVDNATLDPSFSFSTVGTSTITFSALNNKSFTLTSYEIWISYDWGIGVSITGTSPGAAIAEVDTSARSVHLFWQNIPPGTEMQATIKVNSTGNEGEYMLTPSSSTYYNRNKRYYGPCSTARVVFRKDMLPIESRAINNSIIVLWKPSSNPSTVGYRLYKRTSTTDYDIANSFYVTGLTYTDINVQNSVAYYYKVAALDQTGNELEVSPETAEMFLNTKIRTYGASVREKMAIGDIDGNGIPDLAVGSGRVDIYMNNNVSPVPDLTLYGENSVDEFGASLVLVDMNNDGHDDLVVGAPGYINTSTNRTSGKVYVYAGGSSLSQTPVNVFVGQSQAFTCDYSHYYLYVSEELGESISVAGDINADGFKDVAVGSPLGGLDRSGRVLFLLGGPGIVSGTAEITGENCGDHLGSSVAFAGDVNGDGYGDIISGTYYDVNEPGKAYLMYGAPIPYLSDLVFYENRAGYGNAVTGLDIDGDGFSDIGVGANSVIHDISVYRGNTSPDASPDLSFGRPRNLPDTLFVASIGDLNGDGYEDLITSGSASGAVVFMGHNPTDNVPDILLPGVDIKDVKDIDHDGLKEVVAVSAGGIGLHSLSPYADLPHIVVTSPQNYETMDTLSLSLSGFVDGYVTRLLVGGEEIQIGPDGSFEAQVPVVVGRNGIEIIAQGIDGRTAKRKLYGIYGMSPMAVQITSPIDGITVCESLLDVVGTVSQPAVQVKVDWEGAFNSSNMYVTAAGNDFLATIGLFSGLNTVTSTATDPYGIPASHTIQVMYDNQCNIPSITLGAQPQAIQAGQSANLTWTTTYANSVTIDNGIGFVPLDGSITVSPTQTTTYVLSATGPGGTSTTSATITVGPPVPTVVISAQPSSIIAGSSSTLTWSSTNATTAAIDNGIGTVAVAGSLDVSPPQTTTYT